MIKLISDTINKEDINALCGWLQQNPTPQLTKGALTTELEQMWAEKIGTKYSIFVNSGSSAILLALASMKEIIGGKPRIVCPALSWATDVSSPMLLGYDVVLCDCNLTDLSVDFNELERIFDYESPDVLLLVSPLGLVPQMDKITDLCVRHGVYLIEDNCESMGSKHSGYMLGAFGNVSLFSMYYGHHLSSIEGGFINTNDDILYNIMLAQRSHGWDRDMTEEERLRHKKMWYVDDFNELYTFYYKGMNLRSTDLQAFIGLRMIDRLEEYSHKRYNNFRYYKERIRGNMLSLEDNPKNLISNFAYPMMSEKRDGIVKDLVNNGIETRPLIAGSMTKQPFWIKEYGTQSCPNAEMIHKYGFYLPNHQDLMMGQMDAIINIVNEHA
jgi:CDP-4-dehydro-6-deoxyglucose reductase, E1